MNAPVSGSDRSVPPLIAHVIFRLDVGGLENGLVNLINNMPESRYRHAIVCMKDATDFRQRISNKSVEIISMRKRDGKDIGVYFRLWRIFIRLRPDIVHTRNLGTNDVVIPAFFAGVRHRVHGEHGWDMVDLHGENRKYNLLRRVCSPFVSKYITVSQHLSDWLHRSIGVPIRSIQHICNGVDTKRFHPRSGERIALREFADSSSLVIGTVGRMADVKNPVLLAEAFVRLLQDFPQERGRLRLVMVGDGELKADVESCLRSADALDLAWLPGRSDQIPELMRDLDIFVLPSLNEGISNTVLEAMASGLPVVATDVGGNPELVREGSTGYLVPAADATAMAEAILRYAKEPELMRRHGAEARRVAERDYGLNVMVGRYLRVYDSMLGIPRTESLAGQN